MGGHVLIVTAGLTGMLYSSVEFARRLTEAGYEVTYAGPDHARDLAQQNDLDFMEIEPSRYHRFLSADADRSVIGRLMDIESRRDQAVVATAVHSFVSGVRGANPDLLLIDCEMHEQIIAASGIGVPLALLNSFVSIWRQPGLPPPHHMARPGVGWRGSRAGTWLLWRVLRMRKRHRAASQWIRRVGCDRVSILGRLARDSGFDLDAETDDSQWQIPFTYRRFPVLCLHALEFEFFHRPPERVHYVGPMVLESRNDRPVTPEDRTRLDVIFERKRRSGGERKLIYAGFGSVFSSDLGFLQRLVAVVAERPQWDLVISLSDRVTPADLGELPERVHAFDWVPQSGILRHTDVCVTHGGINTIDECVICGVPTVVYCGGETDMAGTTSRVVHHGIGIAGDLRRDDTPAIRDHIDRLLSEPRFDDSLMRLQLLYSKYIDNRVAEKTVASMIDRESHERTT